MDDLRNTFLELFGQSGNPKLVHVFENKALLHCPTRQSLNLVLAML